MNTTKPKFKPAVVQINPVLDPFTPLPFAPKQATNQAVGFDVKPRVLKVIAPNIVHCQIGFKVKPPKGFKLVLVPNSRLTKYNWVMQNSPGQIDPDFRGEVEMRFRAIPTGISIKQTLLNLLRSKSKRKNPLTYDPFPFTTKDVCGQVFLQKVYNTEFHMVPESELDETERGEGGFGSTAVTKIQKDCFYQCIKPLDLFDKEFTVGKEYYSNNDEFLLDNKERPFLIKGAKNYSDHFKLQSKSINK